MPEFAAFQFFRHNSLWELPKVFWPEQLGHISPKVDQLAPQYLHTVYTIPIKFPAIFPQCLHDASTVAPQNLLLQRGSTIPLPFHFISFTISPYWQATQYLHCVFTIPRKWGHNNTILASHCFDSGSTILPDGSILGCPVLHKK